ncbi:MAG: hypothetical protein AMXMBFR58_13410 [Phycisphaerae bacterium]
MGEPLPPSGTFDLGEATRALAGDLKKRIERVSKKRAPAREVHKLRSGSRRIEALVDNLLPRARRPSDLPGVIRDVRKRAGRVRDCDVAIDILKRDLPRGDFSAQATKLVRSMLAKRRKKAERRLREQAGQHKAREIPRRLQRAAKGVELDQRQIRAALGRCRARIGRLATDDVAGSNERLHQLRLAIKCLRDTSALVSPAMPAASGLAARAETLADLLGGAQDLVVLGELLEKVSRNATPSQQTALHALRKEVSARHRAAHRRAVRSLDTLDALTLSPPVTGRPVGAARRRTG